MFNLAVLFVSMVVFYTIATLNIRAAAQGRYVFSATTAFLVAVIGFINIKLIASDTSTIPAMLVYALGGACGDLLGIFISTCQFLEPQKPTSTGQVAFPSLNKGMDDNS